MKFQTNLGLEVVVEKPDKDDQNWVTVDQQSFTIEKSVFILDKFRNDFPNIIVSDYTELLDVMNRSAVLKEWFARISLEYANSIQLPLSVKEFFTPIEYQNQFKEIEKYRSNLAKQSNEIEEAAKEFDNKIKSINLKYDSKNNEILGSSRMLPVLTMNLEKLPISLSLLISKYRVSVDEDTNKTRIFARELLIQYQRALLRVLKDNETVNPIDLINDLSVK